MLVGLKPIGATCAGNLGSAVVVATGQGAGKSMDARAGLSNWSNSACRLVGSSDQGRGLTQSAQATTEAAIFGVHLAASIWIAFQ